jgi:hypothetical protein
MPKCNGNHAAFPYVVTEDWKSIDTGVTKQEYFAVKILASLLRKKDCDLANAVRLSVSTADLLICELNRRGQ